MNAPRDAADILDLVGPLSTFSTGLTDIIDDTFATHDAGDSEIRAILTLVSDVSIPTTDLRHRSGLSRRAHDRLVRQLVEDGLIRQAPAPHDRRVQLLTLTRRGRNRARTLEQRVTDYFRSCGDLVNDVITILGPPADTAAHRASGDEVAPLDIVDRIAALGNTLDAAIRNRHAPKHPKNRDQLALLLIATDDPARPSRIADHLTLTAGGLTKVLDRLETDGLIVRSHDQIPSDRRAVLIALTPDGREVIAAIAAGLESVKPELRTLFTTIADDATTIAPSTEQAVGSTPATRDDFDA